MAARESEKTMNMLIILIRTNVRMLMRQRTLTITSLGLAVLSILIFGALFDSNQSTTTTIGVVNEDHSAISQQITSQLQKSAALSITTGNFNDEQQALLNGHRDAIIVMPAGFGSQVIKGLAHMQVYYNQSNPISAAATRLTMQAIVDSVNRAAAGKPGPVTLDEQGVAAHDLRTIDILTPGILGMLMMWANLSVGSDLVRWRDFGITRRLAATPLKPLTMISGQVTARLLLSVVQGGILMALAAWIFNVHIYGNLGLLLLVVTLGALTMLALGFAIASFIRRPEAAQSITLLISFPMMFLGGSYFDVSNSPSFIQPLIHALPLYYLNDALRQIINNGAGWAAIQTSVLILLAWIVASLIVVWRGFKWL